METLVANLGKARRTLRHGREFVVAPATLIVPGVLHGSKGALYYPPEEVARNVDSWNGMPLVVYHPVKAGKNVSARDPEIIDVGRVYNTTFDGKLKAEAWFDVEMLKAAPEGVDVLNAIETGKQVELSTGLYTTNLEAPKGSRDPSGKPYEYIATDFKPDHLAILPNQVGACSLRDGCGLMVNADGSESTQLPPEEPNVNKAALITWLVANCACWKGEKDKEVLNSFDEAKLNQLKTAAEAAQANATVVNAAKKFLGVGDDVTANSMVEQMQKGKYSKDEPKPVEEPKKPTNNDTPAPTANKMTLTEMLKNASPEEQAVWNHAQEVVKQETYRLANMLVANTQDENAKKAAYATYIKMDLPTLRTLAAAIPTPTANQHTDLPGYGGSFFGAHGGPVPTNNEGAVDRNDVMPTENVDYEALAATAFSVNRRGKRDD